VSKSAIKIKCIIITIIIIIIIQPSSSSPGGLKFIYRINYTSFGVITIFIKVSQVSD